jgi:hypothetical protein
LIHSAFGIRHSAEEEEEAEFDIVFYAVMGIRACRMEHLIGSVPPPPPPPPPLFPIHVSNVGSDVAPLGNDGLRMICIQIAIQLMLALSDPSGVGSIFTSEFILLIVYITLGSMLYWLAIRRIVAFT